MLFKTMVKSTGSSNIKQLAICITSNLKHRPSVFYIFPIETKTKEKTEKKNL